MKYKYFVSYNYSHNKTINNISGFGSHIVILDKKIKGIEQIKKIAEFIENEVSIAENVVILNCQLIRRYWR